MEAILLIKNFKKDRRYDNINFFIYAKFCRKINKKRE